MQKVVIIGQADYVALSSAIHDTYINAQKLEDSYCKCEIIRKLEDVKNLLQVED